MTNFYKLDIENKKFLQTIYRKEDIFTTYVQETRNHDFSTENFGQHMILHRTY